MDRVAYVITDCSAPCHPWQVEVAMAKVDALVLGAWRGLECRDAGRIDVCCDVKGELNFIEVNPLAGLNPVHSDLPMICKMKRMGFEE